MRQADGADLLGLYDPRSANIGVIYVDPNDDRQSVLTAILTQDKLGRKQVVVVLPEQNKAFQRPVDFDGLKNMRLGLDTEIVFVAPSSPAEFARQRRFPTYSSLESFAQSLKAEALAKGTSKRGIFGFIRKPKQADANAIPSVSNSYVEDEPALSLPENAPVAAPQQTPIPSTPDPGENRDVTDEPTVANAAAMDMAGLAASVGLGSLASDRSASSTFESSGADSYIQSPPVTGSQVDENASPSSTPVQAGGHPKPASPNGQQIKAGPSIITLPPGATRPRITRKFPVSPSNAVPASDKAVGSAMQSSGSNAAPPGGQGDSGNMAAVGAGSAMATRTAAGGGSGLPPGGSSPGGPGGGGGGIGGSRRRTRLLLAILLVVLTVLLIAGIAVATNLPGPAITATVTITPDSKSGALTTDTFVITALTSVTKPDPAKREVGARILTSTSQTQMKTVNATGSIPGARATGTLSFLNNSKPLSDQTFGSVTLRGKSGVPISFNGPVTVPAFPGFKTVPGFAVNVGVSGNIGEGDIDTSCCAPGITVRNLAFSGGRNPVPNTVIQQSDINGAADAIVAALTPGVQADLKNKKRPNEEVAPNTLQCKKSTFNANHKAGDIAKTVTVTVAITCTEEVYDQQGALMMAADLLKAEKDRQFPGYALTGKIVTGVTMISVNKTVVTLDVRAEGVWVYQFSAAVIQGFKNHIANMSKDNALKYLMSQQGVASVQIDISSGNTLPDASHITINIKSIPGATGTPTVTPGSPRPTGSPSPAATPTITPTPGLGGS